MSEQESARQNWTLSGPEKASALVIALGAELSSSIMQHLTPDEIERLTAEVMQLKRLDPAMRAQVLDECRRKLEESSPMGGADFARKVLEQVVGEGKAKELVNRLGSGNSAGAFRWLRSVPTRQIAQVIAEEKPQVVALVLGHLPPELAAQVIAALPEQVQGEVALRLTTMQPTDPSVVKSVADILLQRLSMTENATFTEVGGNKIVVQILNNVDRSTEKKILEYLTEADENIANQIKESMFVFEDILNLDDRWIQVILRDVPQDDLRLALKGIPEQMREVFFRNMSQRATETLKEDLESSSPVRLRDAEAAQTRIANIARQLDEAGEITIRDSGDEVMV